MIHVITTFLYERHDGKPYRSVAQSVHKCPELSRHNCLGRLLQPCACMSVCSVRLVVLHCLIQSLRCYIVPRNDSDADYISSSCHLHNNAAKLIACQHCRCVLVALSRAHRMTPPPPSRV